MVPHSCHGTSTMWPTIPLTTLLFYSSLPGDWEGRESRKQTKNIQCSVLKCRLSSAELFKDKPQMRWKLDNLQVTSHLGLQIFQLLLMSLHWLLRWFFLSFDKCSSFFKVLGGIEGKHPGLSHLQDRANQYMRKKQQEKNIMCYH